MGQKRPREAAEAEALRCSLGAAQAGSGTDYAAALSWAAARARRRAAGTQDPDAVVQDALRLIHALRHTYDPARCPILWLDAVLGAALARAPRRTVPAGTAAGVVA